MTISDIDGSEVLKGRSYGGCAILWRQDLLKDVVHVDINSRSLVAILK